MDGDSGAVLGGLCVCAVCTIFFPVTIFVLIGFGVIALAKDFYWL